MKLVHKILSVTLAVLMLVATGAAINVSEIIPQAAAEEETVKDYIETDNSHYVITVNSNTVITARLVSETATNNSLTYSSEAAFIATVDSEGRIYGNNPGTTTIKITSATGVTAEVIVTVRPIAVTEIASKAERKTLYVGETTNITTVFTPLDATNKVVRYASTNSGIINVDASGKVTAIGSGKATVTVSLYDDETIFSKVDFVVNKVPAFNISFPETMNIDETAEYSFSTKTEMGYEVIHTVKNPSIIVINDDGTVTSLAEGKTKIITTITLSDGFVITYEHEIVVDDPNTEPRCSMCDLYEASVGTSSEIIIKIMHTIFHFFATLLG